jgi:L-cystine uptake protein TcyP (sodium:dicarboxylate symporter family)
MQSFKNHSRYVPGYHFVTLFLLLAVLIGAIVNVVNSAHENLYSASLLVVLTVATIMGFFYSRSFALKAQDRAIRAEENLRHLAATGKLLDSRLNIRQVIALRFAPDAEFVELAARTAAENLSSKEIKKAIQEWRADHHRA